MKSEVKKLPKSRVSISVSLDASEFKKHYTHALEHFIADVKLPGFRKGKAPVALVERHVGEAAVKAEAIDHAVPHSYYEVVEEHKLHPLQQPRVTVDDVSDGFSFTAEVDVLPKVEVKDWRKIKVKPIASEAVNDNSVDKVLKHLRKERAELVEVERPVATGDFASISYKGSVDGVEQENMSSSNYPLVLGEGTLIPGFEDAVAGMNVGETKEFDITFPADYNEKSLAKKKARFSVTLDAMKELKLPEVNEQFARDFGKDSVKELREAIEKQLHDEAADEAKNKTKEAVLLELTKRTKADVPETVLNDETERIVDNFKSRLGLDDMKFALYLEKQHKTVEQLREEAGPQAEKNALVGLALGQIMQELDIDPNETGSVEKVLDQLIESATK